MTGARDGRSDGSKQQGIGAALFPRLHVAETKRAGPRGPPRNKMALFEQLTIPSHKFKPSPMALPSSGRNMKSPAMTTPIYLPIPQVSAGSHESMYSYVPMNYMNPTMMPTMACIPSYSYSGLFSAEATHSMNTSGSKSTIMDGAEESPSVGGAVPRACSHSKFQALSKQGRGDDDFAVPTYSSATQSSGQTTRPSSPLHFQRAPRGQRPLPRDKGPVIQKRSPLIQNKCMEVTSSESKENGGWSTASGECVSVCVTGNEGDSQENGHSELERVPSSESYPATAPTDKVCRANSLNGPSEQDMHSNVFSECQSWEDSEPSRQGRGCSAESGSSMLEDTPAGSVQFQDVVNAFGQREFWKTQMILIRQQRIFSRQVFQLHRAIEVQQLLAKALCSSTSIDEALEKEDDNVHMAESPVAESPVAEVPVVPQAESPVAESPVAEVPEVPLVAEALPVPEVAERHPETKALNENSGVYREPPHQSVYPLPVHTQQAFNREAPWPAPSYAPNPWAVRMASSFMYVPYPGPYPPGYGAYPMMGAPMPMYAPPGALQQQSIRFPTWQQQQQQSGMPLVMGAQDPNAMAAWYGQQVMAGVPAAAMAPSAGIAPPAGHLERLTPAESGQSVESTSHFAGTRQPGQVGAACDARQASQAGAPCDARQAGQTGAPFDTRQAGRDGAFLDARQGVQAGAPFDTRQTGQAGARQAGRDGAFLDARQGVQAGAPFDTHQTGQAKARQAGRDGAFLDARQGVQAGAPFDTRQAGRDGAFLDARQAGQAGAPFDTRQAGRDGAFLDARQAGQAGAPFDTHQTGQAKARQAGRDGAFLDARQGVQAGAPFDTRQAGRDGAFLDARQAGQAGAPFDTRQAGRDGAFLDARQAGQAGAPFDTREAGRDGTFLEARQADRDGTLFDARQAGQDVENSNKGSSGDTRGWAKGWGRKEGRWVRGDRSLVHKKASDIADLRGNEANCQNGDTAREGGDSGHEGSLPTNNCHPIVEPEANLEGRQEGMASLKHMRSEGAFESGACRWFPILSPSKRPMHHSGVIKVVPRAVSATPELAANILLSIQTDRRQ